MAVIALTDAYVFVGSHDFTGDSNELVLEVTVNELNVPVFGDTWNAVIGGVKNSRLTMAGYWQSGADTVDAVSFDDVAVASRVVTLGHTQTEATTAYFGQVMSARYSHGGQHGEVYPFSLDASGSDGDGFIQGQLALAKSTVSSTGAIGSGVQLGAVGATEYLYSSFHIIGTPGTTITVVLESDDNAGFTTATTRATIGPETTAGGTWVTRVAGAITDDYFRFRCTAVTGSFSCSGAIGVA